MASSAASGGEQAGTRKRRRRWPYVLAGLLLLLVSAGVALATVGVNQVQRTTIGGLVPVEAPDQEHPRLAGEPAPRVEEEPEPPVRTLNVLLVGLDTRENLTEEERAEFSSGYFEGTRSDTIMLAQVRTDGSAGALLSFPRDLRVTRCDGTVGRINAAYAIGERAGEEGGSCLVETINELTGIGINHYVEIDFAGFVEVIDTLGGVELCPERRLRDRPSGLDLEAGCQRVDSVQALAYVRARYIDDDFGRIGRQQELLSSLLDETMERGFGSDLPKTLRLLSSVSNAVRTDDGLGLGTMRELATSMRGIGSDRLATYHVPAEHRMIGGVAYVIADEDEAEELYEKFREGTVLDTVAAQAGSTGG